MSIVKIIGIVLAALSGALHLATYRPAVLRAVAIALMAAPAVIMIPLLKALTGSLVNSMASVWGEHEAWKMAVAGSLHVLYPIVAFGVAWIVVRQIHRIPRGQHSQSEEYSDSRIDTGLRVFIAGIGAIVAIPLLFFFGNSLFILVESITVAPKSAAELLALSREPGFAWVLEHPTPAIHHSYAATTYFYVSALATFLFAVAIPMSRTLITLIGQEAVMRRVSAFLSVVGISVAILG